MTWQVLHWLSRHFSFYYSYSKHLLFIKSESTSGTCQDTTQSILCDMPFLFWTLLIWTRTNEYGHVCAEKKNPLPWLHVEHEDVCWTRMTPSGESSSMQAAVVYGAVTFMNISFIRTVTDDCFNMTADQWKITIFRLMLTFVSRLLVHIHSFQLHWHQLTTR